MRRSLLVVCALALALATSVSANIYFNPVYFPMVTTPEPTPTPPTTIPPTPLPNTITVLSSRGYRSSSSYYVVGEVANTTPNPVYFVQVTARFYDASNQLIAESDGYTFLERTDAQHRTPFRIMLSTAPATIARYDLSLSWRAGSTSDYHPITILSATIGDNDGVEVFGEVRNDQPREMRGVLVAITFYDAQQRVVEVDYTYATVTTLPPGGVSTYRISTSRTFSYQAFGVQSQGYAAP